MALASVVSVSATDLGEVTSLIGSGFGSFPSGFVAYDSPRIFFEEHTENSDIFVLLNDDFQEIKRINIPQLPSEYGGHSSGYTNIYFYNIPDDDIYTYGLPLTQTVFNNDDNYEYITYSPDLKCYQIVNDKGETLAQITPPEGYEWGRDSSVDLFQTGDGKTDNRFFLVVNGHSMDEANYENIYIVYKIDKATSSIQQVSAYTSKMDVNPRMVRQTPITVTLDEDTDYTSIDIINMSGCIVQSVPVNDEKTVIVDTSRLGHGVYVVKASGVNQSQENCKIIVQ